MNKFAPMLVTLLFLFGSGISMYFLRRRKKLIFRTFLWGCIFAFMASMIHSLAKSSLITHSQWGVVVYCILAVFVEEMARLFTVIKAGWRDIKSNADGMLYAFSASLAIALFENLTYAVIYPAFSVLTIRIFTTISHLSLGVILGFFIARAKAFNRRGFLLLGLSTTLIFHFLANVSGQVTYISLTFSKLFVFAEVILALILITLSRKTKGVA